MLDSPEKKQKQKQKKKTEKFAQLSFSNMAKFYSKKLFILHN